MPVYWLDANVYIQAKNGPYMFERVPKFWEFLAKQLDAGKIRSPKYVYDELTEGDDLLAKWCRRMRQRGLCVSSNKEVQSHYAQIANHVQVKYKMPHSAEFLRGADGWVVAHAMHTNGVVVTQESVRTINSKVKIPTICKEFGINCIGTYSMLDQLDFKIR